MKEKTRKRKKKSKKNPLLLALLGFSMIFAIIGLVGGTFAWYSMLNREAVSEEAEVMRPYTLVLKNSSESDALQLSVGSLMPGQTKQVLFCVSNKDNEDSINMGGSDFEYSMELIYTENLALQYNIYKVVEATSDEVSAGNTNIIVASDTILDAEGNNTVVTTYWKKEFSNAEGTVAAALVYKDVSTERHAQLSLSGDEVNSGKYLSYEKDEPKGIDNGLHLQSSEDGYAAQHFVLEIMWDENAASTFNKYEKETDMIYILVKAIQPKPEAISN